MTPVRPSTSRTQAGRPRSLGFGVSRPRRGQCTARPRAAGTGVWSASSAISAVDFLSGSVVCRCHYGSPRRQPRARACQSAPQATFHLPTISDSTKSRPWHGNCSRYVNMCRHAIISVLIGCGAGSKEKEACHKEHQEHQGEPFCVPCALSRPRLAPLGSPVKINEQAKSGFLRQSWVRPGSVLGRRWLGNHPLILCMRK
jgi:hypothetical protein